MALGTGFLRLRVATAIFALATIPLGALVAIEAQLGLITAGIIVMLVVERRAESGAEPVGPRADTGARPTGQAAGE